METKAWSSMPINVSSSPALAEGPVPLLSISEITWIEEVLKWAIFAEVTTATPRTVDLCPCCAR